MTFTANTIDPNNGGDLKAFNDSLAGTAYADG